MWLPPTSAAGNPVSWSWGFESAVGRISFFIDFQIKTHVRYPPIRRPILKHVGVSYSSSWVLTIRQKTWIYSYHQRISASATADAQSRGGMAGYVPDESTIVYSGSVIERTPTAVRVRIDSININNFKHASHNIFSPNARAKGDLWTFVRRGNGLAPQGQDQIFRFQEGIDD
jgi:hypothetical protein